MNLGTGGGRSLEHDLDSFSNDEHLDMLAIGFKVVKTFYISGFHELSGSASKIMEEAEKMYEKGCKEVKDRKQGRQEGRDKPSTVCILFLLLLLLLFSMPERLSGCSAPYCDPKRLCVLPNVPPSPSNSRQLGLYHSRERGSVVHRRLSRLAACMASSGT